MTLKQYAERYRAELLERVVPFWLSHAPDRDFGGFFTCLDREGEVYDTRKYVWLQGRSVWAFSRLFNEVEAREEWLSAARSGAEFLQRYAVDPGGRCYFSLSREGRPVFFQRKPYSAVFTALGFLEYARASGIRSFQEEALDLLWRIQSWIEFPGMLGRPVLNGEIPSSKLADVMVLLMLSLEFARALPDRRICQLITDAMDAAMRHADPEYQVFIEEVAPNGARRFDLPDGRLCSPGHSIEVAGLMLQALERYPDPERRDQVLALLEGSLELGWDAAEGGLFYFVDVRGRPTLQLESSMKLWWPHAEAIHAVLLAYSLTGERKWLDWHGRLDEYTFAHYSDAEHGGWFGYCDRHGDLTSTCKGNNYKSMYHTARSLLFSSQVLERTGQRVGQEAE